MGDGYLTWAEIEAKYPGEWVLLTEPTTDPRTLEVFGGRVRLHARTRAEFDARLDDLPPDLVEAILFAGRTPLGTTFALHAG